MPMSKNMGDFTNPLNRVFIGDNLPALRSLRDARGQCVDLIYLDPPFNSSSDYNFVYGLKNATTKLQTAFHDSWKFTQERFDETCDDADLPRQCKDFLHGWKMAMGVSGENGKELAYLCHMVPRIVAMHGVLKPTGSIYLHCDQSAPAIP